MNLFLDYLGVLFRDLIYMHDSLPTFIGPQKTLVNVLKVRGLSLKAKWMCDCGLFVKIFSFLVLNLLFFLFLS